MQRCIYINFEEYANKHLSEKERGILNGLQVFLSVDPEARCINSEVYLENGLFSDQEMEVQNRIIGKLKDLLYEDEEIKSLLFRFQPFKSTFKKGA